MPRPKQTAVDIDQDGLVAKVDPKEKHRWRSARTTTGTKVHMHTFEPQMMRWVVGCHHRSSVITWDEDVTCKPCLRVMKERGFLLPSRWIELSDD